MELKLYSRYQNSAGERVRIVLNLKGLAYEYVAVATLAPGAYAAINPQGLLPALAIDGRVVAQSAAIIELLEELFPEPSIFPDDRLLRAEVRAFAGLITADLHPLNNNRVRRYLGDALMASEAAIERWYRHWLAIGFRSLEETMARQPAGQRFCFGDQPTLADACLVPQIDNARRFACPLARYPRLVAIDAECRKLDAFQRAAPAAQPDFPQARS